MNRYVTGALCAIGVLTAATLSQPVSAQQTGNVVISGTGASIGVTVTEVTADTAGAVSEGVRIQQVQEGGPASKAGFEAGDVVVEFDRERVRGTQQFARLVRETPPGREVEAVVVRNGNRQTLRVTPQSGAGGGIRSFSYQLAPRWEPFLSPAPAPAPRFELSPDALSLVPSTTRLGVSVITLDDQLAEYFGVEDGVLVTSVDAGSPAAAAGVRAGDVLLQVGSQTVDAPADVTSALRAAGAGSTIELHVMRDKKRTKLQATLPGEPRQQNRNQQRFRL